MNSTNISKLKIPKDVLKELESVASKSDSYRRGIDWTEEMDAVLVYGWENKAHVEFCKWFGQKYGIKADNTLRARYKLIIKEKAGKK